jgi:hypothetical protein
MIRSLTEISRLGDRFTARIRLIYLDHLILFWLTKKNRYAKLRVLFRPHPAGEPFLQERSPVRC